MAETLLPNETVSTGLNIAAGDAAAVVAKAAATVVIPDNWKEAISAEYRDTESLKLVGSLEDLAKGYVHAQKAVGADKITIPSKFDTPADWKTKVFSKLGLPESVDKYELKADETKMDKDFVSEFKQWAYDANVLPHQAQAMLDKYSEKTQAVLQEQAKTTVNEREASVVALKKEWGQAFDSRLEASDSTLKEVDPEFYAYVKSSPFSQDVKFIKFLSKVSGLLKDDAVKGGGAGSGGYGTMTPAEAVAERNKLYSSESFMKKDHPGHSAAMAESERLAKIAWAD